MEKVSSCLWGAPESSQQYGCHLDARATVKWWISNHTLIGYAVMIALKRERTSVLSDLPVYSSASSLNSISFHLHHSAVLSM